MSERRGVDAGGSLVSGAYNFRDVGGLPAGESATRHGVLYRSGNLVAVDDTGFEALSGFGLRRIIDLRDDREVRHAPSRVPDGVEVLRLPLFFGSVDSFFVAGLTLGELYAHIVDESAERVTQVVRAIVETQPVLVHCTVGKDRTGVTVALTLAAAGVDEDAIIADYARTETLLPPERNERVLAELRRFVPDSPNVEELATRSPAAAMRGLFDDLRARYGSPIDYLRAQGIGDDEIAELRRVLIQR